MPKLLAVLVVAACALSCTGPYYDRCEILCTAKAGSTVCTDAAVDQCRSSCDTQTKDLEAPCAQCLLDNSDAMGEDCNEVACNPGVACPAPTCSCRSAEIRPISYDKCLPFCAAK